MYYLVAHIDRGVVRAYIASLIYASKRCQERTQEDILASLRRTFSSSRYMSKLRAAKVNWIGVPPELATRVVVDFIASL